MSITEALVEQAVLWTCSKNSVGALKRRKIQSKSAICNAFKPEIARNYEIQTLEGGLGNLP